MHGRLFAVLRTVMQATPPIGAAAAAGLTATGWGPAALLGCVAAVMGLPVLLGAADLRGERSVIACPAARRS